MSELELNELDRLRDLKDWNFTVESRMMLDVSVVRGGRTMYNTIALNDAVISKGSIARVVRLNIFTEEGFLTRVGGDGVVLATPTGSTGIPWLRAARSSSRRRGTCSSRRSAALDALELLCPLARAPHHG